MKWIVLGGVILLFIAIPLLPRYFWFLWIFSFEKILMVILLFVVGIINTDKSNIPSQSISYQGSKVKWALSILILWLIYLPTAWVVFAFSAMAFDAPHPQTSMYLLFFGVNGAGLLFTIWFSYLLYKLFWPQKQMTGKVTPLNDYLSKVNTSSIDSIIFHHNNGKSYKIGLESIKQIAVYINQKSWKTQFSPNELKEEQDFLLANYKTNLSEADYTLLVNNLSEWVAGGGSFEIVYKA